VLISEVTYTIIEASYDRCRMDLVVVVVFVLVYVGMILGEFPGLALDRSGIALLGAIAIVASGRLTLEDAALAVDAHTITLLFGLMVISAQFRLGGFTRRPSVVSPRTQRVPTGCCCR
jgi:di/tricarboxylate transporter